MQAIIKQNNFYRLLLGLYLVGLVVLIGLFAPGLSAEALEKAGSNYVCTKVKESDHKHIAVFPFTDDKDTESTSTRLSTARFISALTNCDGVKIIEKSRAEKVLEEQANAQSGLIDQKTAPRIGKMIGADTLVFGSVLDQALEVRLVDAESGTILGATVQGGGTTNQPGSNNNTGKQNHNQPVVKNLNQEDARKGLQVRQMKAALMRMHKKQPALFLYTTSTSAEFNRFQNKRPDAAQKLNQRVASMPQQRQELVHSLQQEVRTERARNAEFNRRMIKLRRQAIQRLRKGGKSRPGR